MTPPRNATIDIAKGIGIILVVLGHNWLVAGDKGKLFDLIFSFHLPLFFFIAGLTLRSRDSLRGFVLDKADALLKPYFVVACVYWIVKCLPQVLKGHWTPAAERSLVGIFYGVGSMVWPGPLWFLAHLFVVLVFCAMLMRGAPLERSPRSLALAACALLPLGAFVLAELVPHSPRLFPLVNGVPRGLPASLDLLPLTASFVLFGHLLAPRVQAMRFEPLTVSVAALALAGLMVMSDARTDLNWRIYQRPVVCTMRAAFGIYLVLAFSALLQQLPSWRRMLTWVGSGSLFVLMFHGSVQNTAAGLLNRAHAGLLALRAGHFAAFVLGVLLPLLLLELVKRQKLLATLLVPRRSAGAVARSLPGGPTPLGAG